MPTYSYACTECGDRFDAVQAFSDSALTTCPKCNGRLRKLFGNVGVVFKGSGFYRTDSRESAKSSAKSLDQRLRQQLGVHQLVVVVGEVQLHLVQTVRAPARPARRPPRPHRADPRGYPQARPKPAPSQWSAA